jgi:hypothetical protein
MPGAGRTTRRAQQRRRNRPRPLRTLPAKSDNGSIGAGPFRLCAGGWSRGSESGGKRGVRGSRPRGPLLVDRVGAGLEHRPAVHDGTVRSCILSESSGSRVGPCVASRCGTGICARGVRVVDGECGLRGADGRARATGLGRRLDKGYVGRILKPALERQVNVAHARLHRFDGDQRLSARAAALRRAQASGATAGGENARHDRRARQVQRGGPSSRADRKAGGVYVVEEARKQARIVACIDQRTRDGRAELTTARLPARADGERKTDGEKTAHGRGSPSQG